MCLVRRIDQDADRSGVRHQLADQFDLLSHQSFDLSQCARDGTTGARQVPGQSRLDWIDEQRTNDRRRGPRASHHQYGNGVGGKDKMRVESHQLFRERRQPCAVEVSETVGNLKVLPFDVAQIAHSLQESSNSARVCLFCCFNEITDEWSPASGLRLHREWTRRRRAAEQGDELAPPHAVPPLNCTDSVWDRSFSLTTILLQCRHHSQYGAAIATAISISRSVLAYTT